MKEAGGEHAGVPTSSQGRPMALSATKPITVDLPERATIFELAMTSPTEGWLVGGVFAPDFQTLQSGLIMRYHDHAWRPVDDPLPTAFLDGIAMVSPHDGWMTGYNQSQTHSYLLRSSGDHWLPVAAPVQPTGGKYYGDIRMLSSDEGWIVVNSASGWRGQIESLLLHYRHGTWTSVAVPTPVVWDIAPVAPDDLWLVGNASTRGPERHDSTLAHWQRGRWTTQPAPDHALLHTLRMPSATAGYAVGWQPQYGWTGGSRPPAVVLQFDGTAWHPIHTGADPAAQHLVLFDDTDAWAFVRTPGAPPRANLVVSAVQRTAGRMASPWQAVGWPFTDIIHVGPMVREAPGEYWAAAEYVAPPERAEDFHWELLHFADGIWQEYPPR